MLRSAPGLPAWLVFSLVTGGCSAEIQPNSRTPYDCSTDSDFVEGPELDLAPIAGTWSVVSAEIEGFEDLPAMTIERPIWATPWVHTSLSEDADARCEDLESLTRTISAEVQLMGSRPASGTVFGPQPGEAPRFGLLLREHVEDPAILATATAAMGEGVTEIGFGLSGALGASTAEVSLIVYTGIGSSTHVTGVATRETPP